MRPIFFVLASCLLLTACEPQQTTADQREREGTARLAGEAAAQAGMPGMSRFAEKKMLKRLYEERDSNRPTVSYVFAENSGKLFKLCDSIGMPIPYATQYSNPQKHVGNWDRGYVIGQPEPNGLFMPASADGTWVNCVFPGHPDPAPVFVEPKVITSPYPITLQEVPASILQASEGRGAK
jgi:hypothetical protein